VLLPVPVRRMDRVMMIRRRNRHDRVRHALEGDRPERPAIAAQLYQ
jgi:hypothetical protein